MYPYVPVRKSPVRRCLPVHLWVQTCFGRVSVASVHSSKGFTSVKSLWHQHPHPSIPDLKVDSRQSSSNKPTAGELKQLAYHNSLPFIGFGFLDNFIMIVAGEYIDLTLGMKLGISTMVSFKSFKILAWLLFRQLQPWATPSQTWWGLGVPGNDTYCSFLC